jgi:hypothetical protein
MTVYDLAEYLCPANGKPILLTSGEHCQCVQCPDDWREQRKNALVEEFYVTSTAVGRGADTSDLWRPGNSYTGTFYVQYTLLPNGTLRYGADWAERRMSVGDKYHRVCTVIVYDHTGKQLKRDDGIHSDLVLTDHHDGFTFPTGKRAFDVLEFQWGGEERYYYAKGFGLVGWMNLAAATGNYLAEYNVAAPPAPMPIPVKRPPIHEELPMPDVPKPDGIGVKATLTKTPGAFVNVRSQPAATGVDVGDLRVNDVVQYYPDQLSNGWVYVVKPAVGPEGWVSLQNGAVVFTPDSTPIANIELTPEQYVSLKLHNDAIAEILKAIAP